MWGIPITDIFPCPFGPLFCPSHLQHGHHNQGPNVVCVQMIINVIVFFQILLYRLALKDQDQGNVSSWRTESLALMQAIAGEAGFTALGFFRVDKTTLTSVLATLVTYFIILCQFNLCWERERESNVSETVHSDYLICIELCKRSSLRP